MIWALTVFYYNDVKSQIIYLNKKKKVLNENRRSQKVMTGIKDTDKFSKNKIYDSPHVLTYSTHVSSKKLVDPC